MLDHSLPYLPVLDSNLRVVWMVTKRDLMLRKETRGIEVLNLRSAADAPTGERPR